MRGSLSRRCETGLFSPSDGPSEPEAGRRARTAGLSEGFLAVCGSTDAVVAGACGAALAAAARLPFGHRAARAAGGGDGRGTRGARRDGVRGACRCRSCRPPRPGVPTRRSSPRCSDCWSARGPRRSGWCSTLQRRRPRHANRRAALLSDRARRSPGVPQRLPFNDTHLTTARRSLACVQTAEQRVRTHLHRASSTATSGRHLIDLCASAHATGVLRSGTSMRNLVRWMRMAMHVDDERPPS